jgi:hypothetical protein
MELVLFISVDGSHAALAAGFFNARVKSWIACAIAAAPDPRGVDERLTTAFRDLHPTRVLLPPSRLSAELAGWAAEVIRVGWMPGWHQLDGIRPREWDLPASGDQTGVNAIRDSVAGHVDAFLRAKRWHRGQTESPV